MKQNLSFQQKLKQTLQMSVTMKQSLDILKYNQQELVEYISELVDRNPVIDYKPSADMHTLLMDTVSLPRTLKDDLYLQLHTCKFSYDESICSYLIESLNENGFLSYSLDEYASLLQKNKEDIAQNLALLQTFEPAGVAAANSTDSIRIQLLKKGLYISEYIFSNFSHELIQRSYKEIAKKCHITIDKVENCLNDIRLYSPYPCSEYKTENNQVIIPDFEIIVEENEIQIIPKQIGHFTIEDELSIIKDEREDIKQYFEEAYYFIDNLSKRNKTMMIMANELFHIQQNHFLYQDELQPCTLAEIAKKSGFHESTVSRTLSNKYYLFQDEVYPVKNLFISSTKEGSSKDSIKKAILKFIKEEDPSHPYKDEELVELLSEIELYASRRAVAKYRLELGIPGSRERKK